MKNWTHTRSSVSGHVSLHSIHGHAVLSEKDLGALLKRSQGNATGRVVFYGFTFDESDLLELQATYYPKKVALHVIDEDDEPGQYVDEHGFDRTPGQWPMAGAL